MFKKWNRILAFILAFALVVTTFGSDLGSIRIYAEDAQEAISDAESEEEPEESEEEAQEPEDEAKEPEEEYEEASEDQQEPEEEIQELDEEISFAEEETTEEEAVEGQQENEPELIPEEVDAKEPKEDDEPKDEKASDIITVTYKALAGGSVYPEEETVDTSDEEAEFKGSTATADEGFVFTVWTDEDGNTVSEEAEFIPSDLDRDAEFFANFEEETVEEEEAKEEVKMPPVSFSKSAGNIRVSVKAGEGAFPEGTQMDVTPIYDQDVLDTAADAVDGQARAVSAVDITFIYKGKEIEPKKAIEVKLYNDAIADADGIEIVHIDDNGDADVVGSDVKGDHVAFSSDSFSIYVIVETGDDARLFVTFKKGTEKIASVPVKKNDQANIDTVLYEPEFTIPDNASFRGWTKVEKYDSKTEPLTIEEVRTEVLTQLTSVTDGDEVVYYAMLFKTYNVGYVDETGTALGSHSIDVSVFAQGEDLKQKYTVNMSYTPADENHDFQGWFVKSGLENIVVPEGEEAYTENTVFENEKEITITGDVTFKVNNPEGHWLIFHENGKGATYIAPEFIYEGDVTVKPTLEMVRNGYLFAGWFKDEDCTEGSEFTFGEKIDVTTHVYAKWTPKEKAPYTIIIHTQNTNRTGYDIKEAYVENEGIVGQNIPWLFKDNKDQDYAMVGNKKDVKKEYTGFCIKPDKTVDVEIKPEGDSVLNLYYDRIEYNFKFYYYREPGTGTNRYSYAENSRKGDNVWGLATYHNGNSHPTQNYGDDHTEGVEGYTAHYFVMKAYYGEDITNKWPKYSQIQGVGGNDPISFVMMVGTGLKPEAYGDGRDTIKGVITILDSNILGATNDANGNFVIVRFSNKNEWRYHIWYETADGEDYTGKTIRTLNGKSYYEDHVVESRSSNTSVDQQNPPSYTGFDCEKTHIQRRNKEWTNTNSWQEGGAYHINYIYNRLNYMITYMDGNYVDGNDNTIQNKSQRLLKESAVISHGTKIKDSDKNYVPSLPSGEQGYIFEGWYADEACTVKYNFTTMPIGGIVVYAKWRQIQYRVFLHPNVDSSDTSLYWGSDDQAMNFRISYGEKISTPTGTRDGYQMVGWFTDPELKHGFNAEAYVLNETTVTTPYDKSTHMTDTMDKYGEGATTNADLGRPWITKEFNLYAKWRATIEGSLGINVKYDPRNGSDIIKDGRLYADNASAAAMPAVAAPEGKHFSHWVAQKWTGSEYEDISGSIIFPGQTFPVLLANAKQYNVEYEADGTIKSAEYDVMLRAEFADNDEPAPTFIPWFMNDGTGAYHVDKVDNPENFANSTLLINEAVDIQSPPERTGYEFLGWARVKMGESAKEASDFMAYNTNWTQASASEWLYYDKATKKFYSDEAHTKEAKQVAADENNPYQAMFAVWKQVSCKYTVYYLLDGAETVTRVHPDNVVTDVAFGDERTESAKTITGYKVVKTKDADGNVEDGDRSLTVSFKNDPKDKEITFFYAPVDNLKYTVHYYIKGTTDTVPGLSDKEFKKAVYGKSYEETADDTSAYKVDSAVDQNGNETAGLKKLTVSFENTVEDQVIIFYYVPKSDLSYTVKYLEQGTEAELKTPDTVGKQTYGETVYVYPDNDKDTDLKKSYKRITNDPQSLVIDLTGNEVIFYYQKRTDLKYVVHYYQEGTTIDVPGLTDKEVPDQTYNSQCYEEAPEVAGWKIVGDSSKNFILDEDGKEIIFYYAQKVDYTYTIKYLDKADNTEVANTQVKGDKKLGDECKEYALDLTDKGYILDESCEAVQSINITGDESKDIIIFYYTKRTDLGYTVHYYEENTTKKVAEDKPVTGRTYKEVIIEKAVAVGGYTALEPIQQTVVVDVKNEDVIFYYAKRSDLQYTVHYYLEGTTTKVSADKVVKEQILDSVVSEKPVSVGGYYIVDDSEKNLKITADNSANVIIFYYGRKMNITLHAIGGTTDYSAEEYTVEGFTVTSEAAEAEGLTGKIMNFLGNLIGGTAYAKDISDKKGDNTVTIDGKTYTVEGITSGATGYDAGTYPTEFAGEARVMLEGKDVTDRFNISKEGALLVINKRPVTFRSASDSKTYDGRALTNKKVFIEGAGLAGSDMAEFDVTGSRTQVGWSWNTFTYKFTIGNPDNYTVRKVEGTLTVTGAGGGGTTPSTDDTTPIPDNPVPTAPTPVTAPAGEVLGERRDNAVTDGPAVLGARRGRTEDTANTTRSMLAILISAACAVSILLLGKKKDEDET
jgi:uncharacterized repeat protein (TIGR02543 family)